MYVCVCVCVRVRVRVRVRVCVRVYVCMCVFCMYARTYVRMYVNTISHMEHPLRVCP